MAGFTHPQFQGKLSPAVSHSWLSSSPHAVWSGAMGHPGSCCEAVFKPHRFSWEVGLASASLGPVSVFHAEPTKSPRIRNSLRQCVVIESSDGSACPVSCISTGSKVHLMSPSTPVLSPCHSSSVLSLLFFPSGSSLPAVLAYCNGDC